MKRFQRPLDVFTREGNHQRTVLVPAPLLADPPPYLSDEVIVGVVQDPATDVESVVFFNGVR